MSADKPWLIIGLGNPGAKYQRTRHNVGEDAAIVLGQQNSLTLKHHRSGVDGGKVFLGVRPGGGLTDPAFIGFPDSYMNLSGPPVARFMRAEGIKPDRLLVIHDDLDLSAHALRLKKGGGEGGHNGLKSITQALGTRDYHRLRIGIGRPEGRMGVTAFVLAKIPKKEWDSWDVTIQLAADAASDVVTRGFTISQQELHRSN